MFERKRDAGAAAVEFALIAMILMAMLMGVIEFGRAWAVQASLAQAAREAAREMAIKDDTAAAAAHFNEVFRPFAAPDSTIAPSIAVSGTPGDAGCRVNVRAEYKMDALTGFFSPTFTVSAEGVMRCGG